jgi:DNA-binding NtrC family response regulator
MGLFESANGGTVFLDEIGEMPPAMQAKLLSAIELREVRPVGAVRSRPIDVRFLSATNIDIETAVERGAFRRDLMYRLNTLTLAIPPLRERRDEIPALVTTFVVQFCRGVGREELEVGPQAMESLLAYTWPGNIRELRNAIERAVVLCEGQEILPLHLPLEKMRAPPSELERGGAGGRRAAAETRRRVPKLPPLSDPEEVADRQKILEALEAHVWNQTTTAEALGMSRRTLVSRLDRYGIPRPQKGRDDDAERTKVGPRLAGGAERSAGDPTAGPPTPEN